MIDPCDTHFGFSRLLRFSWFSGGAPIKAQPLARFTEPASTVGTSIQPTLRIVTRWKIDTTSVWFHRYWTDSTHLHFPTVCVIPYEIYTGFGDTSWQVFAANGTGNIIDDTTFEFHPEPLPNGQKFEAILIGLRVDSMGDTLQVSDTVARQTFTTVALPPKLFDLSFIDSGGWIHLHDTLTARFTSKLDSTNTSAGPLLSLTRPSVTYDSAYDTLVATDSIIPTVAWLDVADSSVLHALPAVTFELGRKYDAKIILSGLTGDSSQDRTFGFSVRKSYRLNVLAAATDGLATLPTIHFDPNINEEPLLINDSTVIIDTNALGKIINAFDTAEFRAPGRVGCAVFKRWSCPGIVAINNSTDSNIFVSLSPDQLRDVTATALYGPAPFDTLKVGVTAVGSSLGAYLQVESGAMDCHAPLLDTCGDTCRYLVERDKFVTLHAFSSTLTFSNWSSSDPNVDGSVCPDAELQLSGNQWAYAVFGPKPPMPPYTSAIPEMIIDGVTWPWSNAAELLPDPTGVINMNPTPGPGLYSATVHILDSRYGLEWYQIGEHKYYPATKGHVKDLFAAGGDGTFTPPELPLMTTSPPLYVTFKLAKLKRTLIVDLVMDRNEMPAGTLLTSTTASDRMWCRLSTFGAKCEIASSSWSPPNKVSYVITYDCDADVALTCGGTNGYRFNHWATGSTYTASSTPSLTMSMTEDKHACAVFSSGPRLDAIMMKQWRNGTVQDVRIPVNSWGDRQNNLCMGDAWEKTTPLNLRLHFDRPIKTIGNHAISFEASRNFAGSYCIGREVPSVATIDSQTVKVTLGDTYIPLWKGQDANLYVGLDQTIRGANGEELANPAALNFSSENPDVTWTLEWFWPFGICDDGLWDWLGISSRNLNDFCISGTMCYSTQNRVIFDSVHIPTWNTNPIDDHDNFEAADCDASTSTNTTLFSQAKIADDGVIGGHLDGWAGGGGIGNWHSFFTFLTEVYSLLTLEGYGDAKWGWIRLANGKVFQMPQITGARLSLQAILLAAGVLSDYDLHRITWGYLRYVGNLEWTGVGKLDFWGYRHNDDGIEGHIQDPDWATPYGAGDYGTLKGHLRVDTN